MLHMTNSDTRWFSAPRMSFKLQT